MDFRKLEKQVASWHSRRFEGIDPYKTLVKLTEEVGELAKAVLKGDTVNAVEEIGDCVIVLCHLARFYQTTLPEAVEQKLPVLEERLKKYLANKKGKLLPN